MGLFCQFTPQDLGFPATISIPVPGGGSVSMDVDYSDACEAFVQTFLAVSKKIVPVDTGFLRSSIRANWRFTGEYVMTIWTDCEYAQYVEYGTWRQRAQPYFEPALMEAIEAFGEGAQYVVDWVYEELYQEAELVLEAAMAAGEGSFGSGLAGMFAGGLLGIGLLILLFPIFLLMYGMLEPFNIFITGHEAGEYGNGGGMLNVIIT